MEDDASPPFQFTDPASVQFFARLLISLICIKEALPTSIVGVGIDIGTGAEADADIVVVDASQVGVGYLAFICNDC